MKRLPMLLVFVPAALGAQRPGGATLDAVVDAYYAYDFTDPVGRARSFATEPARHNEFSLNLALLHAHYTAERVRVSVGLATGTYMEANYAAEPDLMKNVFEGWAGVRLGGNTWLDAGVLPSHIGFESAITPLNATYSRSLIAEYSPYYETGARLTVAPNERFTAAVLVLNGWQNIRETNDAKAVGVQLQFKPTDRLLLNYSNFVGDEAADAGGTTDPERQVRFFHDFYAQLAASDRVSLTGAFDIGTQERPGQDHATWYAAALVGAVTLDPRWTLGLRGELFHDPDQVVVATGTAGGFEVAGGSLNVDFRAAEQLVLRLEGRWLTARDPTFPGGDGLESNLELITSSVAVRF
jgi:hypothetical protein